MLIEDISTAQILTATGFLAALFLIQIFVKKNKFGIQKRLNMSKRVNVVESNKISPSEQVSIIRIDNLEFEVGEITKVLRGDYEKLVGRSEATVSAA